MSNTNLENFYKVEIDANMKCENIELVIGDCEDFKHGDTMYDGRPIVTFQETDGVRIIGLCNDPIDEESPEYAIDNLYYDHANSYNDHDTYFKGDQIVFLRTKEGMNLIGTSTKEIRGITKPLKVIPNTEMSEAHYNCKCEKQHIGSKTSSYVKGDTHYDRRPIVSVLAKDNITIIRTCEDLNCSHDKMLDDSFTPTLQSGKHMTFCKCNDCFNKND